MPERVEASVPFLELRIAPVFSSIRVLNDLLDVALRALGEDDAIRHDLALGVAELVANVCEHEVGPDAATQSEVVVRLEIAPNLLQLIVTSAGPPFDFDAALEQAKTYDPLENLDGSGLGLPLMVGLFDSVDHAYEAAKNRITLSKKRSA